MSRDSRYIFRKVKKTLLNARDKLEGAEAIGMFGSLVRGDFKKYSDIDIFVIVKQTDEHTTAYWYGVISDILKDFRRGVTVIVYSVLGLKEICNWYVLRLAREGRIIIDRGDIKKLFKKIVKTARRKGFVEERIGRHRVWWIRDLELGKKVELRIT